MKDNKKIIREKRRDMKYGKMKISTFTKHMENQKQEAKTLTIIS